MLDLLREDLRSIDAGRKALRSFGLVVGAAFVILGGVIFWRRGFTATAEVPAALGAALLLLGLLAPSALRPLHRVWMVFAVVLGFVMTRVLLTLVFYIAVTPIGVIMRLAGRDPLDRRIDPDAPSYWRKKTYDDTSPQRLEKYY